MADAVVDWQTNCAFDPLLHGCCTRPVAVWMKATWALGVRWRAPTDDLEVADDEDECGRNTELKMLVVLWLRRERESVIADSTVTLMLLLRLVDAVHWMGWLDDVLVEVCCFCLLFSFSFWADWVASLLRLRNERSAPFTRSESTAISAISLLALSA